MFGAHTPNEISCPTCNAGPDRRCGDADGEFAGGVYHAEREIALIQQFANLDVTPIVEELAERHHQTLLGAMHAVTQQLVATDAEYDEIEAVIIRALIARVTTR